MAAIPHFVAMQLMHVGWSRISVTTPTVQPGITGGRLAESVDVSRLFAGCAPPPHPSDLQRGTERFQNRLDVRPGDSRALNDARDAQGLVEDGRQHGCGGGRVPPDRGSRNQAQHGAPLQHEAG
jgi:hypothetical protein